MAVLWELAAGRNFDPFGQAMRGYQAGNQQMRENEKRSVLQQLADSGMSDAEAARMLLPHDPQLANSFAQIGLAKEDRLTRREDRREDMTLRRDEIERNQRNADRSFGLQGAQFGLQRQEANRPVLQKVEDENGNSRVVAYDRNTGLPLNNGGAPSPSPGPMNPYAPGGKTTEGQANAGLYANRMVQANKIIGGLENLNTGASGRVGGTLEQVLPSGTFNQVASEDRQKLIQAKTNFLTAVLRRESGATIQPSEFEVGNRQYFPQPGDGPEIIEQKRLNREEAIKGIMGAAGRGYRPPAEFQPSQPPQRGAQQQPQQAPHPQRTDNPYEAEMRRRGLLK